MDNKCAKQNCHVDVHLTIMLCQVDVRFTKQHQFTDLTSLWQWWTSVCPLWMALWQCRCPDIHLADGFVQQQSRGYFSVYWVKFMWCREMVCNIFFPNILLTHEGISFSASNSLDEGADSCLTSKGVFNQLSHPSNYFAPRSGKFFGYDQKGVKGSS